jgi:hypothetical protein
VSGDLPHRLHISGTPFNGCVTLYLRVLMNYHAVYFDVFVLSDNVQDKFLVR